MFNVTDKLVCGVCKGAKILVVERTGKNDICPKCKGRGYLPTVKEIKEEQEGKTQRVLHG
jgi:hypothetical protein